MSQQAVKRPVQVQQCSRKAVISLKAISRLLAIFLLSAGPNVVLAKPAGDTAAGYPKTIDRLLTRETKLTASDAAAGHEFGFALAISGDTVVVGSPYDDDAGPWSGSAYVFVRSGGVWSQQQKLTAADAMPYDLFGWSVTVSGDTAVVGCLGHSYARNFSGAAYVFVRSAGVWSQQQRLTANDASYFDSFGWSVAVSGDSAVVGAVCADAGPGCPGAAYVFVRSADVWSQQQKLTANDAGADDRAGWSVAISGDTTLVGAICHSDAGLCSGAAYVFVRSTGVWSQQGKLTASDPGVNDQFGFSVAANGDTAVIGSVYDDERALNSGAAFVFVRSAGVWSQQKKLKASDAATDDEFGTSVAVSGNTAAVGSPFSDGAGSNSGSAYVFERSGGIWSQRQKLMASDAAPDDLFGRAVAVSGNTVVVGSEGNHEVGAFAGSAYVYEPSCPACASPIQASPYPITSCGGGDVKASGGMTLVNLPNRDVVLRCALVELPATDGIRINAHSIKVDGPGGGSIVASGKSGIKLNAGIAPGVCDSGATIDVEAAFVRDNNVNGGLKMTACGNIVFQGATVGAGAILNVISTAGKICSIGSAVEGNQVLLTASGPAASGVGDVELSGTSLQTVGSRQAIRLVSTNGNVLAGAPASCPANTFQAGNDGNMTVTAKGVADLSESCVEIGQNITVTALGAGKSCSTDVIIDLKGSVVRNDFGRPGVITMTACGGSGQINVADAVLVDSGSNGGGDDSGAVASLNGGKKADPTAPLCVQSPACGGAVNQPIAADPADRAFHHVVGVPRCDT